MSAWFEMRDSIVGNNVSDDKSVNMPEQHEALSDVYEESSRTSRSAIMRASVSQRMPKVRELPEVDDISDDNIDFDFGK